MFSTIVLRNKDKQGNSTVYVQYSHSADDIKRIPTGIKVNARYFDKAGQKIRKGGTHDVDADNRTIHAIKSNVDSIIRKHLEAKGVTPTVKHLVQEYKKLNDTQHEKHFTDYIDEFIEVKKSLVDDDTIKTYRNLKDNILEYEALYKVKLDFEEINTYAFFISYTNFLINVKKYLNSTIQKRISLFGTVLKYFYDIRISKSIEFKSYKFTGKTVRGQEPVTLNVAELEMLKALDLTDNKRLERVRDLFIVECWTGLRYVDFMGMSKKDFKHGKIKRYIEKTDEWLTIPLFDEARQVLEKYDYQLKRISNDKYNEYIKDVCALVPSFQEEITKVHFSGNEKITVTKKKCDWISTHTARRVFVTLLLELNVNPAQIMRWTGHTSLKSFERYINKQQGEQAEVERLTQNYKQKVKENKQKAKSTKGKEKAL
jgi:site-specific recombinase XerD